MLYKSLKMYTLHDNRHLLVNLEDIYMELCYKIENTYISYFLTHYLCLIIYSFDTYKYFFKRMAVNNV